MCQVGDIDMITMDHSPSIGLKLLEEDDFLKALGGIFGNILVKLTRKHHKVKLFYKCSVILQHYKV